MPARSYLFAPGNDAKLLERVFSAGADAVCLDLEDAVPSSEKDRARDMVASVLAARQPGTSPLLYVRVNAVDSGRCHDDVKAVLCPALDGIRLPKVESAEAVANVARLLPAEIALHCTLETARGVLEARAIAAADPSVRALVFGAADFARDIGVSPSRNGQESLMARSLIVLASRAAGIEAPIDSAYLWLNDEPGLRDAARRARALGFGGKSALHPRQLAAIHDAFGLSEPELAEARNIVAAFEAAHSARRGVARLADGTFVDKAMADRAQLLIARSREGS